MKIAAAHVRKLASIVFGSREQAYRDGAGPLTAEQAEAIIAIAEMTVDVDDRDDADEAEVYDVIAHEIRALAGGSDAEPVPVDDADLDDLAASLTGPPGELAYVVAYVLTIADLAIEPTEEVFLEDLRDALSISEDRADELVDAINAALSPGE